MDQISHVKWDCVEWYPYSGEPLTSRKGKVNFGNLGHSDSHFRVKGAFQYRNIARPRPKVKFTAIVLIMAANKT